MIHAIKEIQEGRKYLCSEARNMLTEQLLIGTNNKETPDLSRREIEVIGLIKKGYSSKEIADSFFLSVKTVEVHRYNILKN